MPDFAQLMSPLLRSLDDRRSTNHRYALFAIMLAAFALRWYALYAGHGYIYFAIKDEIQALKYALDFLAGEPTTYYLGQPALNQGHIPGPLWSMFVALIYKLGGSSVEGMFLIMAIINSLVIYPVYRLALKILPPGYALLAALSYALAPWAIYYSVGIYNPMLLGVLGALLFLALWNTLDNDNSRAVFWVMLLSAAIPQIHMIGVFYYPAILLLLIFSPARLNRRWLFAGAVAGVTIYLPYLVGEMLHQWSNLHGVLSSTEKFSSGVLKILTIPVGMLTNHPGEWPGYHSHELIGYANRWFGSYLVLLFLNIISLFLALWFVIGFSKRFFTALRNSEFRFKNALAQHRAVVFIGTLLVLPLLCYVLTGKAYATRYSIFIFPLLFLLPAWCLANCGGIRLKRWLGYSLAAMLVCNIYVVLSFYTDLNRQLRTGPQFMPAFYKLEALKNALHKYAGKGVDVELDTSHFIDKNNKYHNIVTNAVKDYMKLNMRGEQPKTGIVTTLRITLADSRDKLSANAKVIYSDNGLFAYTKQK